MQNSPRSNFPRVSPPWSTIPPRLIFPWRVRVRLGLGINQEELTGGKLTRGEFDRGELALGILQGGNSPGTVFHDTL